MAQPFIRGQVWLATLPGMSESKMYVVVSNSDRNRALGNALAVRVTSTRGPDLSSIVQVPRNESIGGYVLCDDVEFLYPEDTIRLVTGLTGITMARIGDGLRATFGLT